MTADLSDIPENILALVRKYPSWGAAAKANDAPALRALMERHRQSEQWDPSAPSQALVKAAATLTPACADVLIEFGATLDERLNTQDAAQVALGGKNSSLLFHFLDRGLVPVDHAENDGTTLLMAALMSEQFDVAEALHARGADVSKARLDFAGNGDTALHLAAAQASFQGVIWLIEKGADPSIENSARRQPCEVIPTLDPESAPEWDLDAMFDALENYREARAAGAPFEIPLRLREMAYMESTPLSSAEAQMKAIQAQRAQVEEHSVQGVIPKKKMGF